MSIKSYIDKKTGKKVWSVRVSASSVKECIVVEKKKSGISDYQEARTTETRLKNEAVRELTLKELEGIPWKQLSCEFIDAMHTGDGLQRKLSPSTADDYSTVIEKYTRQWDNVPANKISRIDVMKAMDRIEAEGKTIARKRRFRTVINAVYDWAIYNEKIKDVIYSPAYGLKFAKEEEKKPEILTLQEIKKLLEMAKFYENEWYPMWATALMTGMRNGELYALEWKNTDLEEKRIFVVASYDPKTKSIKSTKGKHWREVPINSELEIILKELKLKAGTNKYVLPRIKDWERGEQARRLREFCMGIGITPVKVHTLRACFATQLLRANVAPAVVMKICGWKGLKTMQIYVRLAGIEIDGATDSLEFLSPEEASEKVVNLFKDE